jgi:CheY-like chemotaxis protein
MSAGCVLVVDDNTGFLRVARAVLESAAFAVHTVKTGKDALAFLERRPPFDTVPRPSFVVLDFHLPDMKAPAVLQWLIGRDDLRRIPVLVMSQADLTEAAAARAAGATAFRVKPSRVHQLREAMLGFWEAQTRGG